MTDIPVGTENIRNQKKYQEGKILASKSVDSNEPFSLMQFPPKSTKPMAKKQSIMGTKFVYFHLLVVVIVLKSYMINNMFTFAQ